MKKKYLFLISSIALPMLFSCNSRRSNLNYVNKLLADNEVNICTCYDAVSLPGVKETLAKIKLEDKQEFVYDSKAKRFVIMEGDKIVLSSNGYQANSNKMDYFKFVDSYNPNSQYSQYLIKEASGQEQLLITTGFDCGEHKDIRNVTYTNLASENRNVIIRTYCDYFTVYAPNTEVNHFNSATNVIITDVQKFNTFGSSAYFKAVKGTINFDPKGETNLFEIPLNNKNDVIIESSTQSVVRRLINCDTSKCKSSVAKKLNEIKIRDSESFRTNITTASGKDFIRLESDIIFSGTSLETMNVDHSIVIDLNGFKLSLSNFKYNAETKMNEAIRISSDGTSEKAIYLIDSQGVLDNHSGIFLNNCSIAVVGNCNKYSKLILDSGKITQTISGDNDEANKVGAAVAVIGDTSASQDTPKKAQLAMYGGKIECVDDSAVKNKFGCISLKGSGADVNVVYGLLTSNEFCVFGDLDNSFELNDPSIVEITGGDLTSTKNTCIYFPYYSSINIETSILKGASCVNVNSGSLAINNSTLTADGTGAEYSIKNYDGSVIYVPKAKLDKKDLTIDVVDSLLTSKFEYIAKITGNENTTHKTTINFNDGTYTYRRGDGVEQSTARQLIIPLHKGAWQKQVG